MRLVGADCLVLADAWDKTHSSAPELMGQKFQSSRLRTASGCWSVTPAKLRTRFSRTNGFEPIFRSNDGSTCNGADVSTLPPRRPAFSLLLDKGLIRIALDVAAGAEDVMLSFESMQGYVRWSDPDLRQVVD